MPVDNKAPELEHKDMKSLVLDVRGSPKNTLVAIRYKDVACRSVSVVISAVGNFCFETQFVHM